MWSPDAYIPNCEPKDPKDKNNPFASIDSLKESKWDDSLNGATGIKAELRRLMGKKGHNGTFMAMMFISLVVLPFFGAYQQNYHQLKAAKQEQANQSSVNAMNKLVGEVSKSGDKHENGANALAYAKTIYTQLEKGWKCTPPFWTDPDQDPNGFAAGLLDQLGNLMGVKDASGKIVRYDKGTIPTADKLEKYWEDMWTPPTPTGDPSKDPKQGNAPQGLISAETAMNSSFNGFAAKRQTEIKYYGAQLDQYIKEMHDLMSSIINCMKKSNQQSQGM